MAVYTFDYSVHTFDSDARGFATLSSLCNYMLDAASANAKELGFGYEDMKAREFAWVLSRFLVRVERYPRWQEKVRVKTWPSGTERIFALRDFVIEDESGAAVARATTSWIAINAATRAPERIERLTFHGDFFTTDRVFEKNAGKVPGLESIDIERRAAASYSDIDLNNHVTSVRYVQWAIDTLPPEVRRDAEVRELEVNYLAEGHSGDDVRILATRLAAQSAGNSEAALPTGATAFLHSVVRQSDGTLLCRLRSEWKLRVE